MAALGPRVGTGSLQVVVLVVVGVAALGEEDHSLVVLAVLVVHQHSLLPVGHLQFKQRDEDDMSDLQGSVPRLVCQLRARQQIHATCEPPLIRKYDMPKGLTELLSQSHLLHLRNTRVLKFWSAFTS